MEPVGGPVHLGVLFIELQFPAAQSLKDKRRVLKSLTQRLRNKFNVSVAELGDANKWQRGWIGVSIIGNDRRYLDSVLQSLVEHVDSIDGAVRGNTKLDFL